MVRRGLAEHLTGATFVGTEVLHPRAVRSQEGGATALESGLRDARVTAVRRRGKYLWLDTADGGDRTGDRRCLLVHLGMSGQMLLGDPGEVTSPHLRIRSLLVTASGRELELSFVDQRTFGRWELTAAGVTDPVPHIARDPLDPAFTPDDVARLIRRKRSEIKRVLLDQKVVSGIGNIYADEALWAAGVHPETPASRMTQDEVVALLSDAGEVMTRALAVGGTSFDDLYVNVNGASGYFSRSLNVYGREGEACRRCGEPIVRESFMNRSSHYCPRCQRRS